MQRTAGAILNQPRWANSRQAEDSPAKTRTTDWSRSSRTRRIPNLATVGKRGRLNLDQRRADDGDGEVRQCSPAAGNRHGLS